MAIKQGRRWATGVALLALVAGASPALSQEVVQALPAPGSQELGAALQRLARNSGDIEALIDAGDAALLLGDIPAAIGFFGRAEDLAPTNSRVSYGLARAYTRSRRPVEALRLFAVAERGGIPVATMAADRALAFDLVGDAASAQELYRVALAQDDDPETRRHFALSQAISGNREGFEATLLPLLQEGNNAAFRTRAFGLAILGDTEAAVTIADDMMPQRMAARVAPYLRYMPRLTPAQQAAAGSLGVFPRTAAIGRDDASIAGYATSSAPAARSADASLAPAGPALGRVRAAQERQGELPPRSRSSLTASDPLERTMSRTRRVERDEETSTPAPAPVPTPAPPPPPPPPSTPPPAQSVEDAFSSFDLGDSVSAAPRSGAVDITAIEVPREVEARRAAPTPPAHPSRYWVQVATGRDISALGFDWRRISRNADGELAGKNGFTAPWGEANRLLAGPYESATEAREVVGRLKANGIDSFPFTSASGEEIFPLAGARPAPAVERHPARHWVQVATGRDLDALGFDWRRIAHGAQGALDGIGPFTVPWGEANRLLAGPFDSRDDAREMVNRLKERGIDTFPYSSEDGERIVELD